jgi:predicted HicB family RNase H-like nuclease
MNILEYKGFLAKIEYSLEDEALIGRVINAQAVIGFEAENASEVEQAFHECIDGYLASCKETGIEPKKPYSGKFNFRTTPENHALLVRKAEMHNLSLNAYLESLVEKDLQKQDVA